MCCEAHPVPHPFASVFPPPAANLQEKLTDFLPKLLDCSAEIKSFHDPPKLPTYSTLELSERFSRVMASVGRVPSNGR